MLVDVAGLSDSGPGVVGRRGSAGGWSARQRAGAGGTAGVVCRRGEGTKDWGFFPYP
jgi:hypothetical protein